MSSFQKYISLLDRQYFSSFYFNPVFRLPIVNRDIKPIARALVGGVCGGLLVLCSHTAFAQQAPDAGAIQQEIEAEKYPVENKVPEDIVPTAPPEKDGGPEVTINQFNFYGNTLLGEDALFEVVRPWMNKVLSLAELNYVSSLIAKRYQDSGYLVRVYLPKQNIKDGTVVIAIVEAKFGKAVIQDSQRIDSEIISSRFAKRIIASGQSQGDTLDLKRLERTTLILNDLPGIVAKNILVAGEHEGETDVSVDVSSEPQYSGAVSIDNHGVKSTGETRVTPSLTIANPFRRGDDIRLIGLFSEGNLYGRASYGHPLMANGLRGDVSASFLSYRLGAEFEDLNAKGDAVTVAAGVTYPVLRQLRQNLNVTGRIEQRDYENSQLDETVSDISISAIHLGVNGNKIDSMGKGGISYFGATLAFGDVDLSGNATNQAQDALGPETEGSYSVLSWNYGRLQKVADKTNVWASLIGQVTGDKLDSSETISLGGPNGVRAYPVLEASGDSGAIFTLEVRHQFDQNILLTGFFEYGQVIQKETQAQEQDTLNLKGIGASLLWTHPSNFSASIDIARRIGDNPLADEATGNDSNGSKTLWPVWISVSKHF
ncbi:ShlB/FhaC/HecB family hemolysin secretion/activation protein [Teredinibacter haidensis]|uniref:ShlB/FhaC/HecB family hemolysin secretion/activation protein n=1 Tax=Teredinibacter haidensis TaxID=2731755 RepID=UPI00094896F7|nr:ShlB/FhaC/HecB family hemolysin secretion/activation protein [Teredinibacter haidensis]